MADVLAAGPDVESSGQALVDSFLERLAVRDNPPPPRNDPASLRQRLGAALRQQLPHLMDRRLVRMAHICYAFFQQASWSAAALTAIVGGTGAALFGPSMPCSKQPWYADPPTTQWRATS